MSSNNTRRDERAAEIFRHYGLKSQLIKLREECEELRVEAENLLNGSYDRVATDKFIEELADVQVMILQFREAFGRTQFEFTIDYKIERTLTRMKQ